MTTLRDDTFAHRGSAQRTGGVHAAMLFAFVFASIALLVLSRLQHSYVKEFRAQVDNIVAPVLSAAVVPLAPVRRMVSRVAAYADLYKELERLRDENQRMRGWEWRARESERKYSQLGRLARVVEEPGLDYTTARVVADSRGPFVRSAMLSVGRDQGLKPGFPVISADGVIGRITETGRAASRVLLLTDINSRIPVFVGRNGIRALLVGDNGAKPRLTYLPANGTVEAGDEVSTSGVGGLFPRGLRIGTVVELGGKLAVQPHAQLDELDFVSVLLFENPTLELADVEKSAPARRSVVGRVSAPVVEY
jgi:rod shape-determining protein MreC